MVWSLNNTESKTEVTFKVPDNQASHRSQTQEICQYFTADLHNVPLEQSLKCEMTDALVSWQ